MKRFFRDPDWRKLGVLVLFVSLLGVGGWQLQTDRLATKGVTNIPPSPSFTANTQMNEYMQSLLNGCSPTTEFTDVQGSHFSTDALAGCTSVPGSSTMWQSNAVAGYAVSSSNSTNVAGGYFQARGAVAGYNIWGLNPVAFDFPYPGGGGNMTGIEVDTQPQGPAAAYNTGGKNVVGIQDNLFAPQAGSFGTAIAINVSQTGNWTQGILFNTGALGTSGTSNPAIFIQPGAIATNSNNYSTPRILRAIMDYWNGSVGTNTAEFDLDTVIGSGTNPGFDILKLSHSGGPGGISSTVLFDRSLSLGLGHSDGTAVTFSVNDHTGNSDSIKIPAGNSSTVMPASLTTTSGTSDNVTVTGMTASGHCGLTATNASAATNIATTYISSKTTNQITVTHTATASMTYDILCTPN